MKDVSEVTISSPLVIPFCTFFWDEFFEFSKARARFLETDTTLVARSALKLVWPDFTDMKQSGF